jgi:hypothetical protein
VISSIASDAPKAKTATRKPHPFQMIIWSLRINPSDLLIRGHDRRRASCIDAARAVTT